nr:hypothetical protein [Deltaproteobacteria bacterium]
PVFTITARAVGPLTAATPGTLVGLRAAFAGYDVAPVNSGGLEYRVSRVADGALEELLEVVPATDGSVLNVHAVSPAIAIADRPWQIGSPFTAEHVTTCECWGERPVCFTPGEHVAVAIGKPCRAKALRTPAGRKALAGAPIAAAIWSPKPLADGGVVDEGGEADDEDDD